MGSMKNLFDTRLNKEENMKYFEWIGEVTKLLELPLEKGIDFIEDAS